MRWNEDYLFTGCRHGLPSMLGFRYRGRGKNKEFQIQEQRVVSIEADDVDSMSRMLQSDPFDLHERHGQFTMINWRAASAIELEEIHRHLDEQAAAKLKHKAAQRIREEKQVAKLRKTRPDLFVEVSGDND